MYLGGYPQTPSSPDQSGLHPLDGQALYWVYHHQGAVLKAVLDGAKAEGRTAASDRSPAFPLTLGFDVSWLLQPERPR